MYKFRLSKFQFIIFYFIPHLLLRKVYPFLKYFDFIEDTKNTQTPITFEMWYDQMVLRKNYGPYWPVHPTSLVQEWKNVYCGIETSPGYSPGNYISASHGKIFIGDYTQIAPNVGLIASNHQLTDNRKFQEKTEVRIGKYCWIGMGAIILPGVQLGDYTIVAAGAIVTKSFKEGYQVIGGNPAKLIKLLNPEECVFHKSDIQYNGYVKAENFENFRLKFLNV